MAIKIQDYGFASGEKLPGDGANPGNLPEDELKTEWVSDPRYPNAGVFACKIPDIEKIAPEKRTVEYLWESLGFKSPQAMRDFLDNGLVR